MSMRLVTNSIDTNGIVERTIDGDRHLVAEDVVFIRAMDLAGGYVPSDHVANSADAWAGAPLTVNHPRDETGEIVSAQTEHGKQVTVGHARNPRPMASGAVKADLVINADVAEAMGGDAADIVETLESGESLEVSSQYYAQNLEPGVYDGEQRANVEGNLRPDSIALLPNKKGVCSLEDGCGFAPGGSTATANAQTSTLRIPMREQAGGCDSTADDGPDGDGLEDAGSGRTDDATTMTANVSVGGIEFEGVADGTLEEADIPNDEYGPHYVFDADTKSASSFPLVDADGRLRRGNVAAAFRFRADAPDTDELLDLLADLNERFDDPPIDPESLDEVRTANTDSDPGSAGVIGNVLSFLGLHSNSDEPAESGADADTSMDNRDTLIDEITSNSAISASSLADACDERVRQIHDDVVSNSDNNSDDGDDAGADADAGTDTSTDTSASGAAVEAVADLKSELQSMREEMVTEDDVKDLAANAQAEQTKRDLAETVVANSAEYDDADSVLESYPTVEALEAKRDQLTSGGMMPAGGATANADLGGDDEFDVGSGVLGE